MVKKAKLVKATEAELIDDLLDQEERPYCMYTVSFYKNRTDVVIVGFENTNPAKLEKSMSSVHREWSRQQQAAIIEKRVAKRELETEDA